jgi:hypothetical protein
MNTSNPYFEEIIKSSRAFLAWWNGAWADIWELTPSLKTLRILIRRVDPPGIPLPGNLLISCIDPVTIKGPVRWNNCDLRVMTTTLPGGQETGFLVADDSVGLEIICGALEVEENVKLY